MREITLSVHGKKYKLPAFSTAREILEKAGMTCDSSYSENPIIGALVNGKLSPLGTPVPMSCSIEPVRAFQGFGRRIYRHSICFLLCYASKLVFPKRRLVIGHSLGDGFFFNYEDGKDTGKEEIEALSAKMRELVQSELSIDYVTLSVQNAIRALKKQGFEDAVLLLQSRRRVLIPQKKQLDYLFILHFSLRNNKVPLPYKIRFLHLWSQKM